jgi:Tfp pilus assembly PilM family ATPase
MLTASTTKSRTRRSLRRIGLEFDTSGLFCAQVTRVERGWKLTQTGACAATAVSLAASPGNSEFAPFQSTDLLLAAAGFRGASLASVLPMEVCDLRVLEFPTASPSELELMIRNEVEGQMAQNAVFDFWTLPSGVAQRENMTGVCSLCTDRDVVGGTVSRLQNAGFVVEGIDGLPTACARAVTMMVDSFGNHDSPNNAAQQMCIHIGWKTCLLVLVQNGVPVLARVPRVGGLCEFLSILANCLQLQLGELIRLIRGLHRGLPVQISRSVRARIEDSVLDWCLPVCDEITRSLSFARRPGLRMTPSSFIIMGPGAVIPGLQASLSHELGNDVQLWDLPSCEGTATGPEFAVAAALSAWEIDE